MLLRFRVANHGSLREEQELSLIALDHHDDLAVRAVPGGNEQVLPVAGVFGPNASGKSNLMGAIGFVGYAVRESHQAWLPGAAIPRRPFLLDAESREHPSSFAVDFVLDGVRYEYGFECDDTRITEEWLNSYPERRRRALFSRSGQDIKFGPSLSGRRQLIAEVIRPNSLYLSAAAANNHPQLTPVYRWFRANFRVVMENNSEGRLAETLDVLEHDEPAKLLDLLRYADLGVTDIRVSRRKIDKADADRLTAVLHGFDEVIRRIAPETPIYTAELPGGVELRPEIRIVHRTDGNETMLPLEEESSGTQTWLTLIGPVLKSLRAGRLLVIDELDARLHPLLAGHLIKLFQDPATNPAGAQLVFNTHDTTLLGPGAPARLRRDQVWLTDKSPTTGATELFPLTRYRVREGLDNVERGYLHGRYGAVPYFDEDLVSSLVTGTKG